MRDVFIVKINLSNLGASYIFFVKNLFKIFDFYLKCRLIRFYNFIRNNVCNLKHIFEHT